MPPLANLDTRLFYLLNSKLHAPFLDWLMPVVSDFSYFRIPIALTLLALFIWGGNKGRWFVILGVIAVGLADFSSHQFLKPLFARPRVCHQLETVRLLVHCGGKYGFPSNHACNFFGTAVFFLYFYRRLGWFILGLAFLIGWSRVYVGVHYPLDVLGGAVWGTGIAITSILLARKFFPGKFPVVKDNSALSAKSTSPVARNDSQVDTSRH
jgi:undecaprenyl-diphosphatase